MIKGIKEKVAQYKATKRKKEIRRSIRRFVKKIFSKEVFVKIVIIFSGLALIASFTLPYII